MSLLAERLKRLPGIFGSSQVGGERAHLRIYLAVIMLMLVAGLLSPEFLHPQNLTNVLRQSAALGIVSIGQTIVMIGGGFDLSVTATMQLATVMMAELSGGRDDLVLPAVLACLLMGLTIGMVNGVLVSRRREAAFMVTLAVGLVVTGARLAYTEATPSGTLPPALRPLSQGDILGFPFSLVLLVGLTLLTSIVLRKTVFGRELFAVGTNRVAARLSGVPVGRVLIATYAISGLLAALAGLVLAAYIGYIDQWLGGGYDLGSIAAAAIGGVSLAGGRGSAWGTLAGVLLIMMLLNFVLVVGLPVEYQYLVRGFVVILAVGLYSIRRKRQAAPYRRRPVTSQVISGDGA